MKDENCMRKPRMILFDYGQTLVNEAPFDGEKATAAVMEYATENKYGKTPKEIQAEATALNWELGRLDPARRHLFQVEVPHDPFDAYLYESNGIRLSISYHQAEKIFWDTASPGMATEGIKEFLAYLKAEGIRTGVISNISYSGEALKTRLQEVLPEADFEFIIASSEYVFRKPNPRIFRLALEKAGLEPEDVWYVGDQYECDIVGAGNVGMFPVWYTAVVDFEQDFTKEAFKISCWRELQDYLSKQV